MEPIRDHLETYVVVAIGHRSCCPLPGLDKPIVIKTGELVSFWIRAIHRDAPLVPEATQLLHYSMIDEFGNPAPANGQFSGNVTTDAQGYGMIPSYKANAIGSFRLRVDYSDRGLQTYTLSQPIVVK